MYDQDSKGLSFSAGFFMLIAFTIAGIMLAAAISIPIWTVMTGSPVAEMEKGMSNPAYSNAVKTIQAITTIIGFFLPAVLTASLLNRKPWRLLGFSSHIEARQTGLAVLILASALFVGGALTYFNYQIPIPEDWKIRFDRLESGYNQQTEAIMGLRNTWDYVVALVIMGFLPALCEETLFRGGLQNFLYRSTKKVWLTLIISSILFSIVHLSYYGFLFRFLLGFILGWIYHYSGKIWLNILIHFLNNAFVITIYYISIRQGSALDKVQDDTPSSYWGLALLPILIGLLLVFKRISFNSEKR